jgi:hypothetical protein
MGRIVREATALLVVVTVGVAGAGHAWAAEAAPSADDLAKAAQIAASQGNANPTAEQLNTIAVAGQSYCQVLATFVRKHKLADFYDPLTASKKNAETATRYVNAFCPTRSASLRTAIKLAKASDPVSEHRTHDVTGDVLNLHKARLVSDDPPTLDSKGWYSADDRTCYSQNGKGYAEAFGGARVVAKDGDGHVLATTRLHVGVLVNDGSVCEYRFTMKKLPLASEYTFAVGDSHDAVEVLPPLGGVRTTTIPSGWKELRELGWDVTIVDNHYP